MMRLYLKMIILSLLLLGTAIGGRLYCSANAFTVEVINSDDKGITLRYTINDFSRERVVIDGQDYYRLRLADEAFSHTAGEPELPYISRSVIINDQLQTSVEIISADYYETEMRIIPSKGILMRYTDPESIPYTFSQVYDNNEYYPGHLAVSDTPYILRDFRGQVIRVHPLQYNPLTAKLRVYRELVVQISYGEVDDRNVKYRQDILYQREFTNIYRRQFINFNSTLYNYRNTPARMIVIAFDAFMETVNDYAAWKIRKGIPTAVYPVSGIGNTAAAIKTFILNQYNQNDGLVFVQLVGDHLQVPSFIVNSGGSDPTYSLLAGDDNYPDIFVGRFSAETVAQARTQTNRSIHYEKDIAANSFWLTNGLGIASSEGSTPSDIQQMESIRARLLNYNYTFVERVYAPNATAAQVINTVNNGSSIINYAGHGSSNGWTTTGFNTANVNGLTNDFKLPFIISVACVNGNFTSQTCFAEAWLRATNNTNGNPTGAIGIYASSINQAWYPPLTAQDKAIDYLVSDTLHTVGELLYSGSMRMMDLWAAHGVREFRNWNIFGDASLSVRNMAPPPIAANHSGHIIMGDEIYRVATNAANAAATLTDTNNNLLAYGKGDNTGQITLRFPQPPNVMTTLLLTVTAHNRRAYFADVDVTPLPDHPYIMVSPDSFYVAINPGGQLEERVVIVNRGEEELLISLSQSMHGLERSISDSWIHCSSAGFTPDSTVGWHFTVRNNSTDEEPLASISLTFPQGIFVNSADSFTGGSGGNMLPDNTFGEGIQIIWQGNDGNGIIFPGETATAVVNVTVSEDYQGDVSLPYRIEGDGTGEEPHSLSGNIFLYNENDNWLTITPSSGNVPPGDTLSVSLLIDSSPSPFGEYYRSLDIRTNDPTNRLLHLPITMLVVDEDQIHNVEVTPVLLQGNGYSDTDVQYQITVENTGIVPDNFTLQAQSNSWNTTFWYDSANRYSNHPSFISANSFEAENGYISMRNPPSRPEQQVSETGIINPGQSKIFIVKVRIPAGATGHDNCRVLITSQGNNNRRGVVNVTTTSLGYNPDLPVPPARFIAEFEPMQGVLIRYPLGLPYALIRNFAEHTKVYTIVANQTTQNAAITNYQNNQVNLDNCEFIIASTNSYWTRDYGPWFVTTGTGEIAVGDFTYNRPRPSDNAIPTTMSTYFDVGSYFMPVRHTGGNIMSDGMGKAASTDLVAIENSDMTIPQLKEKLYRYMGVDDYMILPDPTGDPLKHIDIWAKFLDVDKIMLRSVPPTHNQYDLIEDAAQYFSDYLSSYGTPFRVYRVNTPNNEPYLNSLIINNRVYVPQMNNTNDAAALQAYRTAMPGYDVIGFTGDWRSNDSIHCRTIGIPDLSMLRITHTPPTRVLSGLEIVIEAEIIPYSNEPLSYQNLKVFWKTDRNHQYSSTQLYYRGDHTFAASIAPQSYQQDVYYYIEAVDLSGRREKRPYIGAADPFTIEVTQQGEFGSPQNVTINIEDNMLTINWDKVPWASSYIVEAADEPEGEYLDYTEEGFFFDFPGIMRWSTEVYQTKRFFRIIAVR